MLKQRKHNRLPDFDYTTNGYYFVTICSHQREMLFGKIESESMVLNQLGQDIYNQWNNLPKFFPNIEIDESIVMPNHIHSIIILNEEAIQPISLSDLIRRFKSFATKQYHIQHQTQQPLWQRGFYEHVIRNERALHNIREYIMNNPLKWHLDEENPVNW